MSDNPYQSPAIASCERTSPVSAPRARSIIAPFLLDIPLASLFGGVVFEVLFTVLASQLNLAAATMPTAGVAGLLGGVFVSVTVWCICQGILHEASERSTTTPRLVQWVLAILIGVLVSPVAFFVAEQSFHTGITHWDWCNGHLQLAIAGAWMYAIILWAMQVVMSFRWSW